MRLCWSSRSLRKLQDDALHSPVSPTCRPYVFEGVDEGGRWYNGSRRTDGPTNVGGFQFHMCELRSATGTLSSGLGERTDGRTDRSDDIRRPYENPLCGSVCATTKQQLRQRETMTARSSKQHDPLPDHRSILWDPGCVWRFAGRADFRRWRRFDDV